MYLESILHDLAPNYLPRYKEISGGISGEKYRSVLAYVLSHSAGREFLWFGENWFLANYGGVVSYAGVRLETNTGTPIRGRNVIVRPGIACEERDLRQLFVLMEFMVERLVRLLGKPKSAEDHETNNERIIWLRDEKYIERKQKKVLRNIFDVRNQFAHSINSAGLLRYYGANLSDCYSVRNSDSSCGLAKHYFVDDVYNVSEHLLDKYRKVQGDQIDIVALGEALEIVAAS